MTTHIAILALAACVRAPQIGIRSPAPVAQTEAPAAAPEPAPEREPVGPSEPVAEDVAEEPRAASPVARRPATPSVAGPPRTPEARIPTVAVVVRNPNADWAELWVDGALVVELRNEQEVVVDVEAGRHTLTFREYMTEEPFAEGQLDTLQADRVVMTIDVGRQTVQVFNHRGWSTSH